MTRKTILIVDDEADIRNLVKEILEDEGYATLTAANSKEVYSVLESEKPDMAILDIWLQDSRHDGLQILETIKSGDHAAIPVIMISGHGTIETAVSAIKQGAYDFIEKPFKSDRLILMVKRGLEAASLQQENAALKAQSRGVAHNKGIIGSSSYAKALRERVQALASCNSRLSIEGPIGCGKTTIARMIHEQSSRSDKPFIIYACCAGAKMRGSIEDVIENTKDGTVVFQNIDSLDNAEQALLLKIVQNDKIPARIVTTSLNKDGIDDALYQRLALEQLIIPPLSDRKGDIADIVTVFAEDAAFELGIETYKISQDAIKLCEKYQWPGNYQELKASVTLALMRDGGLVSVDTLPSRISGRYDQADNVEVLNTGNNGLDHSFYDLPLREARDVFERQYLTSQVERFEGNISKTAQFVGMERSALHRKIKSLQDKDIQEEAADQKTVSAVKT